MYNCFYFSKVMNTMQKSPFRYIIAAFVLLIVATAPVVAQSSKSIYRVAVDATADGDGSSWTSTMPLATALSKAKAGDEVWVRGYQRITADSCYYAPATGFQMRSGVRVYGGLTGTETTTAQASAPKSGSKRYVLTNQSVLLADVEHNDSVPANYIIFPENPTRKDNSRHCLVMNLGVDESNLNDANLTTIVSGFVFAGGNASGSENSDDGHGGGLLIVNRSSRSDDGNASKRAYEVSQCYFVNNYGSQGGAIYVDPSVTNTDAYTNRIRYCGIYNNASGTRSSNVNCGGGVWLGGTAVLCNSEVYNNTGGGIRLSDRAKVVNTTIVHNTISAVDLTEASLQSRVPTSSGGGALYNTVLWGSTTLSKTETKPAFRNCAFPELNDFMDDDGNVEISTSNYSNSEPAASFTTPTSDVGYDRTFSFDDSTVPIYSFEPMDGSMLIDNGDNRWYTNYVSSSIDNDLDIMGSHRHYTDNTIDIGAVEHEVLAAGRRLYVKTNADGGSNSNDGSSWDNALADPQTAIDRLYGDGTRGKGEVWVAKGVYVPQKYISSNTPNDQTTPLAFQMRNGISVYGGFKGDETSVTSRELNFESGMIWDYVNTTIFRGADYTDGSTSWNATEELWNVSSKSYHVVWFAANPYEMKTAADAEFSLSTVLDGITVEGGSASENGDAKFAPCQGAGIYMMGSNNVVRRCVVRNNNAGMKTTANGTPQGGGIYNLGGQVRYSLVYNNSASEGGGVYISAVGFVNNSMLANNSAVNGSGLYIDRSFATQRYQIAAVNLITNNTSTGNGAVYVKGDGVVEQNTIANNYTSNVTDETGSGMTSYTGGLYLTGAAIVINNIIYNNSLRQTAGSGSKLSTESLAQVYAYRATRDSTLFYNNAISDVNSTAWNGIYQSGTYELATNEFQLGKGTQYTTVADFANLRGVQPTWRGIDYFWHIRDVSILRDMGLLYGQLEQNIIFKPSTDFLENPFDAVAPIGPYRIAVPPLVYERKTTRPHTLRVYYDGTRRTPQGNGSSWDNAYTSFDELLRQASSTTVGSLVTAVDENGKSYTYKIPTEDGELELEGYTVAPGDSIEIVVREGTYEPSLPYTYQENDPRSSCFNIKAQMSAENPIPLTVLGGYPSYEENANPADSERNPAKYRTVFTGNASGTSLEEGRYHVFRVETGADFTLDGAVIEKGYAAGTAFQTYGAAMLVGSLYTVDAKTKVTLRDCIIENNSAHTGAALAMQGDCRDASVHFVNCVINNNQTNNADLIDMGDDSNTLSLDHVTIVNNIGVAPRNIGKTSFAAGNETFSDLEHFGFVNPYNTIDIATTGKDGAANFANPSNKAGAAMNGNVYYGGNATYRPLTSSVATDAIINRVTTDDGTISHDVAGNDRNLGGAPDLGAYEALLPKAGKVIYVRSYNTDWTEDDCIDGTPDFNLINENPGNVYDGLTWSRAIHGNAVCDTTLMNAGGNAMYVLDGNGRMLAATLDNTKYGADYNATTAPYGQTSNAYGEFFTSATSSKRNGNYLNQKRADGSLYNLISNNRDERYISGLQIAIERAARYNAAHKNDDDYEEMSVWVGAGVYTDFKGFVIRNGVKVFGGYPKDGNPGENERRPLLSQYVPARKGYEGLNKADYETILQIRKESPVYLTESSREIWYSEGTSNGSKYDYPDKLIKAGTVERHYVLYQPDVCLPTYGISGDGLGTTAGANQYRTADFPQFTDPLYQEYKDAKWDGFSVRHGYITNYTANRDGGAGVRVFRGIRMENLIIVNNFTHGSRSRGGGMYLDGDNSIISNSFMLRNFVYGNSDCYGGGAYMIQGVGYNLVVASNRSWSYGGGIFIESAKFFNNTVAYNMTQQGQGAGIMHWQDNTTGITSALTLYNCIIYDNLKNDDENDAAKSAQVGSTSPSTFHESYNNYINGTLANGLVDKFTAADGNVTSYNTSSMPFPFAIAGNDTRWSSSQGGYIDGGARFNKARAANDFRLNEGDGLDGNPCLNGGTEDMPMVPATDMDYTDRIKDCTIDIGAYEADNTANISPETKTREKTITNADGTTTKSTETYYVYYVTETGYGNRSGSNPENAACAEKLQSVLTAAGQLADSLDYKYKVYVKVAGYEPDEDGERFVYHVNTLADADDPQSYTYLVPQGVWMYGGYNEGTWETTTSGTTTTRRLTGYNWDNDARDVITSFLTVLSAKTQPREGSAVEEVTGYHTVSFGKWPKGDYADYALHALPGKMVDGKLVNPSTGIDGVHLIDGAATDNDGMKGMGGGAVVPAFAHVRNSIITDCQAIKGGALFMLPGSIVSGSVIHDNKARQGGAIYAANGKSLIEEYNEYRAYMASCTIAENSATEGGGIYQELGALFGGNSVIWGNTATTDKNISGVVDKQFKDLIHHSADPTSTVTEYFPYNRCFVERYLLPGDMGNVSMTSDFETYFATAAEFSPRPYSPLINNGVTKAYQRLWESLGVATHDVKGVARGMKDYLTVGAYAMVLPDVPEGVLLRRLFVSADGGAEVSDEVKAKYVGRSFYTPFNTLDAALAYINHVRTTNIGTATSPRYLATVDDQFEIFMTGGTYRPSVVRQSGGDVEGSAVADRRMQSFELPLNVAIFGGFDNTDPYSSTPSLSRSDDASSKAGSDAYSKLYELETINGEKIPLTPDGYTADLLKDRNTKHRADLNKNGLMEPWEFANPTIFSGDIKASESERKVYHVVYSNLTNEEKAKVKAKSNLVLLDGITIANGETSDAVAEDEEGDEDVSDIGHGGGLFSWNVNYTLNRCRVINNRAVHGGGIFIHDATLNLLGTAVSGNLASSDLEEESAGLSPGRGGAVCATFAGSGTGSVHALNSLFANNTAEGNGRNSQSEGGAIYVDPGEISVDSYPYLNVVNSNIVRNSAMHGGAVFIVGNFFVANAPKVLSNTVCWGNESLAQMSGGVFKPTAHMGLFDNQMSHCATGLRPATQLEETTPIARISGNGNIVIDRENMTAQGPRFKRPSTVAGHTGFDLFAQWDPAAISVLTDAGDGSLAKCDTLAYDQTYEDTYNDKNNDMSYMEWLRALPEYATIKTDANYSMEYISYEEETLSHRYIRFMGPLEEETGEMGQRPIDIGMYEFQYKFKMPDLDAVYIGTEERGDGSGDSWANQSTDLRGAIIAMANPTGNTKREDIKTNRFVYVRDGEYYSPIMTGGDAFSLIVNTSDKTREMVTSVELVGSCEGGKKDANGKEPQDFSKPTVIVPNPFVPASSPVNNLLNITANGRPVTISGFSFRNDHFSTVADSEGDYGGRGVTADVRNEGPDQNASLTLKNCAFEGNRATGLNIEGNEGKVLVYNVLFADGGANGMDTRGKTTIVNATFAQNQGYDYTTADGGVTDIYNSVSWQNGGDSRKHNLADSATEPTDSRHNTSFQWGTPNDDVLKGPNFTSPKTADSKRGDYSLRPSVMLFNTGDSTLYIKNALDISDVEADRDYMSKERDLMNVQRIVGGDIDRGAFECTSKLLPIIYVKSSTTQAGSGESWEKPANNLQNAINLAELYANTSNGEDASKAAYVFVDKDVVADEARITLPGVKIYGTMDNETSKAGGDLDPTDYRKTEVDAIVAELLQKRKGLLEHTSQSRISDLSIDYTLGDGSDNYSQLDCVVDGFHVDGEIDVKRGYLSTSIVDKDAVVAGTKDGVLYNSLVYGKVQDVRSVNVTAVHDESIEGSGTLPDVVDSNGNGCAANRSMATLANRYVDASHWRWQLNEFYVGSEDGTADYSKLNSDINANADSTQTVACADAVCHRRDLAGNLRFRVYDGLDTADRHYNWVDNGCFETWYVPTIYTATTADQPHGKSVIYVREEQQSADDKTMNPSCELRLAPGLYNESNPFTPGFLLLKHHAGLRGNGNYITLNNLAVEREMHMYNSTNADGTTEVKGYPDLCVMPFSTSRREQFENGKLEIDGTNDSYTSYAYNGLTRAAYDYKFDAVEGKAWQEAVLSTDYPTEGMMIVPHKDFTLRFYTLSYNEHGTSAALNLMPYCFQEPWSSAASGGVKFTHKENMGWNLFGSPFLCAMNYSDMNYSRVIYVNDILIGGGYTPLNTASADGGINEGYIPACDAVFTQTATLSNYEMMLIGHSAELSGSAYQGARTLTVQLSAGDTPVGEDGTRGTLESAMTIDNLQLNAVDSRDAHSDFDISSDGVKWLETDAPQIYAVNGQGRYSLLSAVSREGEVKVGISVPCAGLYTFSVPADCDRDGYEAVLLKDSKTGKAVDLLDDTYQFAAAEAGEQNSRFTITFTKAANGKQGIVVRKTSRSRVSVNGLEVGDEVNIYSADGRLVNMQRATSTTLTMSCQDDGVVVVEVVRGGKQVAVRKIR